MLSEEQTKQIQEQLLSQLDKANVPNKEAIKASIKEMNSKQLEDFLKQNKLLKESDSQDQTQCIFCSIVDGKLPSYKLDENEEAIAILELNPISKGHTIIIPKVHSEKIPGKATDLAKKVAEKIKKLNPKKIEVIPSKMFGHEILNVLPVYKDETLESPKNKAEEKELSELQKLLGLKIKKRAKRVSKPKTKKLKEKKLWLPKRIP
jgi:hypothetical protein